MLNRIVHSLSCHKKYETRQKEYPTDVMQYVVLLYRRIDSSNLHRYHAMYSDGWWRTYIDGDE